MHILTIHATIHATNTALWITLYHCFHPPQWWEQEILLRVKA